MKIVDHTGKAFGRLLVIGMLDVKNGHKRWLCQCSCGGEASSHHKQFKQRQHVIVWLLAEGHGEQS